MRLRSNCSGDKHGRLVSGVTPLYHPQDGCPPSRSLNTLTWSQYGPGDMNCRRQRVDDALSGYIHRPAERQRFTHMQASPFRTILLTLRRLSPLTVASSRIIQRFRGLAAVTLLALPQLPACSGQTSDLTQKSLEDLMNIEVTSVSKKEQKTSQVAAAVFVISREDIRNSGALNVPDLLRMVPGLDVAQIDGEKWAISIRGFNGHYSQQLT